MSELEKNALLMPVFDFPETPEMTMEEFEESIKPAQRLEPNQRITLQVVGFEVKAAAKNDPTWFRYQAILSLPGSTLGGDGKPVNAAGKKVGALFHSVMTPTKSVIYSKDGKETGHVFRGFREFMLGLGFDITPETIGKQVPTLFKDTSHFIGRSLVVIPGYESSYIGYEDGAYKAFDRNGKLLTLTDGGKPVENSFADRNMAEGIANQCGAEIDMSKTFMRVLKFIPAETPAALPSASKKKAKAVVNFDDD